MTVFDDVDDDDDEEHFYPLVLKWTGDCWSAGTRMLATESWMDFGTFKTVAAANAAYRVAVGLTGRVSEVFVNDERHCRVIINGRITSVRPEEEGVEWWKE